MFLSAMFSPAIVADFDLVAFDATAMTFAMAGALALYLIWCVKSGSQMTVLAMDAVTPAPMPEVDVPNIQQASSIRELERLFRRLAKPQFQASAYQRFAERAGLSLTPQEMWLLQRLGEIVGATEADLPEALRLDPARLQMPLRGLQAGGYVTDGEDSLCLTEEGRAVLARMVQARKEACAELFSEWAPGGHYEIQQIIDRFTKSLNAQMPPEQSLA